MPGPRTYQAIGFAGYHAARLMRPGPAPRRRRRVPLIGAALAVIALAVAVGFAAGRGSARDPTL